jgi:RNA polymerase sigma factor (sigma-70 family)
MPRSEKAIDDYLGELRQLRAATDGDPHKKGVGLRASIARLTDKVRLAGLERKIATVAALARRELRKLERAVAASFGLSTADICQVAASIEQKREEIRRASERLVESNLRLVVHLAQKANRRGADVCDLIQEGNLALLKAVDTFDPERGVPFGSFASISVRHAIHCSAATAKQLVRVPEALRVRRTNVRKATAYLSARDGHEPSVDAIAEYLEVSSHDVVEALEDGGAPCSLDSPIDEHAPSLASVVDTEAIEAADALGAFQDKRLVRGRISALDERKRRLIESRYGVDGRGQSTLAQIGRELGVTRERVRQIQESAFRELRTCQSTARSVSHPPRGTLRRRLSRVSATD